ncbi:cystathionine beta-lyase [Gluconacetobacter azotocaptans]|uniref:Cystathionine beta-lyase n=1 Tax=Gluconacetobacter azotocaptans TaxID=142834 RepID=A0A7W4JTK5_9PROT|nr:cystathionine beta-lyase [Gluconacetobacter azotocaptans]MBB2190701.1 cystathionine beta-lyase [Gluconacetobacter azotocaptans]MBM9400903.1 cystathionine beta-lyase [Gluconacetobacter azotocaptans]GBQ30456.1 cytochrome c class I [Gluconacetobacter azotocaptans DSM 13594]
MRHIRFPKVARAAGSAVVLLALAGLVASPRPASALDGTRTTYLVKCGGCHGIEGLSGQTYIPVLRDRVGSLTCTPEGRSYLVQVPGVSMSLIRDDAEMARVLNFVVFDLGGSSTPKGTRPYTAEEVHALRSHPLRATDLPELRAGVWGRALTACAAQAGHAAGAY